MITLEKVTISLVKEIHILLEILHKKKFALHFNYKKKDLLCVHINNTEEKYFPLSYLCQNYQQFILRADHYTLKISARTKATLIPTMLTDVDPAPLQPSAVQ